MPRCCASILDPNNKTNVVVHVEVDAPDEAKAQDAAKTAALEAFNAGGFAGGAPDVELKSKRGQLTKDAVDAL
jgi:hypothetical protein